MKRSASTIAVAAAIASLATLSSRAYSPPPLLSESELYSEVETLKRARAKYERKMRAKYGEGCPLKCEIGDLAINCLKNWENPQRQLVYRTRLNQIISDPVVLTLHPDITWIPGILNPDGTPAPVPTRYEDEYQFTI